MCIFIASALKFALTDKVFVVIVVVAGVIIEFFVLYFAYLLFPLLCPQYTLIALYYLSFKYAYLYICSYFVHTQLKRDEEKKRRTTIVCGITFMLLDIIVVDVVFFSHLIRLYIYIVSQANDTKAIKCKRREEKNCAEN